MQRKLRSSGKLKLCGQTRASAIGPWQPGQQDESGSPSPFDIVSFMYKAGGWQQPRKVVARLDCSPQPITHAPGGRHSLHRHLGAAPLRERLRQREQTFTRFDQKV
jgi:hypothetical protein